MKLAEICNNLGAKVLHGMNVNWLAQSGEHKVIGLALNYIEIVALEGNNRGKTYITSCHELRKR